MTSSGRNSSRLRRAASTDRLTSAPDRRRPSGEVKCDLVGFPYCCTKHYYAYRHWPYYLDPVDYPYYSRYHRLRHWPDNAYGDCYQSRPWYHYDDDYYGDYLRGYAEGMRKYDSQRRLSVAGSVTDLTASAAAAAATAPLYTDRYPPYSSWWYYRPSYYRRYL